MAVAARFYGEWLDFFNLVQHLPGRFILPDLLGHGTTNADQDYPYTMAHQVQDLNAILTQIIGEAPVNLWGYSMGGRVAIAFAATYPQKVAHLYLESTRPGMLTKDARHQRQNHDANLAAQLLSGSLAEFVDHWEALPLFASQTHLNSALKTQVRKQRLVQDKNQLAKSLTQMGTGSQPNYWPNLLRFNFQTTVITGQLDLKFTQIGQAMLNDLPQGQGITVPNVGHNVHLEAPETVQQILKLEG